MSLFTTSNFRS